MCDVYGIELNCQADRIHPMLPSDLLSEIGQYHANSTLMECIRIVAKSYKTYKTMLFLNRFPVL